MAREFSTSLPVNRDNNEDSDSIYVVLGGQELKTPVSNNLIARRPLP